MCGRYWQSLLRNSIVGSEVELFWDLGNDVVGLWEHGRRDFATLWKNPVSESPSSLDPCYEFKRISSSASYDRRFIRGCGFSSGRQFMLRRNPHEIFPRDAVHDKKSC